MALFSDDYSINSILGNGSSVKGNLKINGCIHIDGDLDGNLESSGNVIIGEHARINGNINAKSITVGGLIKGDIIAPDGVHLLSSSIVIGDIQTHRFQADKNVLIHGHCIALSDESFYSEAVQKWQDRQAIAGASILKDIKISLPEQGQAKGKEQESEWK